ncbi:hypothetical protein TorRG33x02_122810 [Trema orientale]|uniref:Pectinesterase inhibitor domain containing protein n=1 Tax=Trema orientale TaxID=63057 RepID=A0A2P5F2C0_TREOI|nr:hypothetical protein TorRG33x02_122810 [Trema orientale]
MITSSATRFLLVVVVVGAALISSSCDAKKQAQLSQSDIDLHTCVIILTIRVGPMLMEDQREKICTAFIDGRLGTDISSCLDRLTRDSDVLGYELIFPIAIHTCHVIFDEMPTAQLRLTSN